MDLIFLDKIGDLLVALSLGGFGYLWNALRTLREKVTAMELDLAKNYVTKPELKSVEDKLDHLSQVMTDKIDRVNDNIMVLLRTQDK